jgi:photosystem II stability/assembly factor-like uncharacterized protein
MIIRFFYILFFLIISCYAFCQGNNGHHTINLKNVTGFSPRCIGPSGIGRVNSFAVHNDNPNYIIVGAASGGVWMTSNSGTTWRPIFDNQPTQNIGAVAIYQKNPAVIWVGTGDCNPRNTVTPAGGIYQSSDSGKTWQYRGLKETRVIKKIIIDPTNPSIMYVSAMGDPFKANPERGVYKTVDGGRTWKRILFSNDTSGCADIVINPANPQEIYASLWQFQRTPWSVISGGAGSGLYFSKNGGISWEKIDAKNGLPSGSLGKIGIAISPSHPNIVYALVEAKDAGLYHSKDKGKSWTLMNNDKKVVQQRPFYFYRIFCDPKKSDKVWLLNQNLNVSENGGKDFEIVKDFHGDHHDFWISPRDPLFVMTGSDGGFGLSRDGGLHWQHFEQLSIGEFYGVETDNETPYHVMGGAQDNGSWMGKAYSFSNQLSNLDWLNLYGGDGYHVIPGSNTSSYLYVQSQGGQFVHMSSAKWLGNPETGATKLAVSANGEVIRYNWSVPLVLNPFDKNSFYYGSQFLHKGSRSVDEMISISSDLTTNDSTKTVIPDKGGLTPEYIYDQYCSITTIAPSSVAKGIIWVGTDDGNVQLTSDDSKTWQNVRDRLPGLPERAWISQIKASTHSSDAAFVVANHYRTGDTANYVFRTNDLGKSWTRMKTFKKGMGFAVCIQQDTEEPNLLFLGTSNGLHISFDNGETFQHLQNGFSSVQVSDLKIQEKEADLVIATFGRSFWILDNISTLRQLAHTKGLVPANFLFEIPPVLNFRYNKMERVPYLLEEIKPQTTAENRPRGLPIDIFFTPHNNIVEKDSLKISILSGDKVVSIIKEKLVPGLNRIWLSQVEFILEKFLPPFEIRVEVGNITEERPLVFRRELPEK